MLKLFFKSVLMISAAVLISCSSDSGDSSFFKLKDLDGKRVDGSYSASDYARNGTTYTVTAEDCKNTDGTIDYSYLSNKVSQLQSGDTLILDGSKGTFYSKTIIVSAEGITIKGASSTERPVIDFSATYGTITKEKIEEAVAAVKAWYPEHNGDHTLRNVSSEYATLCSTLDSGRGVYVKTSWNVFENLVLCNAADSGLKLYSRTSDQKVNNNLIKNVEVYGCGNSGVELSGYSINPVDCCEEFGEGGPSNNKFFDCYSHDNADLWNLGENADGFAVKAGSGDGNYFENCIAEYNSDDGWDCYRIRGSTTWVNCIARYNGLNSKTGEAWADFANGNGFKVGGGATSGGTVSGVQYSANAPSLHRHAQYLKDCIAYGNAGNSGVGFDRNNQYGSIYLENCWASGNKANLFAWDSSTNRFKDTYKEQNYSMNARDSNGNTGDNVYVLDCYIGKPSDPYDLGKCNGVKNTITGVKSSYN